MTEDALATGPTTHEGTVVAGKFRLDHVLGEGGMGVVYAATNLDLLKRVAIKIIRDELGTSEGLVARLLHEARSAARLESEHVARVLDVGRMDSGAPYIVMECLDGCDLATHLHASGALSVETAVLYLLQACEAVAEAHAAGILHCDIKPENLFLSFRPDGESILKVLDFGIARNLTAHSKTAPNLPEDVVGSPSYMAPEAMRPDVCVGPAADIWSLGAVLYELVTAQKPFDADRVADIFDRVMNTQPAPPRVLAPSIPEGLEAIILRCLTKKEEGRFASVADLAAALAAFGPAGSAVVAARVARIGTSTVPRTFGLRTVSGQTRRQAPRHLGTVSSVRRRSKLRLFAGVLVGAALASSFAWWGAARWVLAVRTPAP
ncbi:MAG: serine/threonine protein kinase, partial [Polyangiaceae bacterium]|nr:serine/threonine protein kinase [Polyangiaceae bacterium]